MARNILLNVVNLNIFRATSWMPPLISQFFFLQGFFKGSYHFLQLDAWVLFIFVKQPLVEFE